MAAAALKSGVPLGKWPAMLHFAAGEAPGHAFTV